MKTAIICNPAAGQRDPQDEIRMIARLLQQHGWHITSAVPCFNSSDTTAQARAAADAGCDAVFVAGGDGTISRAVDGLVGSKTALAVVPAGTANVLARQLNLPVPGGFRLHAMLDAVQMLLAGRVRTVDAGRVSLAGGVSRHFLCWSGVGFDAHVAKTVDTDQEQKRRLGALAFVVAALLALRDYGGTRTVIRVDGRRIRQRTIMLVANNIQLYGAWIRMAPGAALDDGWLDVYAFRGQNPLRTFWHALWMLIDRGSEIPDVSWYRARRIEVITARPLPVHVDGDTIGYTPAIIEIVPQAVNLIVPPGAPASLFAGDTSGNGPVGSTDSVPHAATRAPRGRTALLRRSRGRRSGDKGS